MKAADMRVDSQKSMIFKSLEGFDVDGDFLSSEDSESSVSDKSDSKPSFHM